MNFLPFHPLRYAEKNNPLLSPLQGERKQKQKSKLNNE